MNPYLIIASFLIFASYSQTSAVNKTLRRDVETIFGHLNAITPIRNNDQKVKLNKKRVLEFFDSTLLLFKSFDSSRG